MRESEVQLGTKSRSVGRKRGGEREREREGGKRKEKKRVIKTYETARL